MTKRISVRDSSTIKATVEAGEDFHGGGIINGLYNFRGLANPDMKEINSVHDVFGRLPEEYKPELTQALELKTCEYIIYSYQTPIAWKVGGKWTMVDDKFSRSTTGHQSALWLLA